MIEDLFSGLLDGVVIDFHLLREILFKPCVFFYVVIDELDGELTFYLDGGFACFAVVKPCFCPPSDTKLVWIDTDKPGNIETLYVNFQSRQWIHQTTRRYGSVLGFFFSTALMLDRNI